MTRVVVPLDIQRKLHCSHFVYRALNQETTNHLNNMFGRVNNATDRVTRSTILDKLVIPSHRTECVTGNIRIQGARLYNVILLDIRESNSIHIFKRRLKSNVPFESKYT